MKDKILTLIANFKTDRSNIKDEKTDSFGQQDFYDGLVIALDKTIEELEKIVEEDTVSTEVV